MASRAEQILKLTDHPIGKKVAEHAASGLTFGEVLAKFDLSEKTLAKIHQNKSSIETSLKMGTPVKDVIYAHFTKQSRRDKIMATINKAKAMYRK